MSAVSSSVRAHCVAHSDNFDHDYWLELPVKESEVPNHYAGDLLHALAISGLSLVRTLRIDMAVASIHCAGDIRETKNPLCRER